MPTLQDTQPRPHKPVAIWPKVLAAILDFSFAFYLAGYVVGYLTGDLTDGGFELKGIPALIVFALVAGYFVVFVRFLGGTVWQCVLRTGGVTPRA